MKVPAYLNCGWVVAPAATSAATALIFIILLLRPSLDLVVPELVVVHPLGHVVAAPVERSVVEREIPLALLEASPHLAPEPSHQVLDAHLLRYAGLLLFCLAAAVAIVVVVLLVVEAHVGRL